MVSARITVERGVVGFGLDYACAHIIISASGNLLPIQADFVIESVIGGVFFPLESVVMYAELVSYSEFGGCPIFGSSKCNASTGIAVGTVHPRWSVIRRRSAIGRVRYRRLRCNNYTFMYWQHNLFLT